MLKIVKHVFVACFLAAATWGGSMRGEENNATKPLKILVRDFRTIRDGKVVNFNIGTTAHGPGLLTVLEKNLPEAEIYVWASAPLDTEIATSVKKRFPKIRFVYGKLDKNGVTSTPELADAIKNCDFLLGGSGSGIAVPDDYKNWKKFTGKPYGFYGIGFARPKGVMNNASFVALRDSKSVKRAEKAKITSKFLFGPDGAFGFNGVDEGGADKIMDEYNLKRGEFFCCVTRTRVTERWLFFPEPRNEDKARRNQEMMAQDNLPLREAICRIVRETGKKVLICPETASVVYFAPYAIYADLPADVKPSVAVLNSFWSADTALAVYRRSAGVFGLEMHSQVMAIGSGIPAIVCRTKEFGTKSEMWRDIGLGNWLFDFDIKEDRERFPGFVANWAKRTEENFATAARAKQLVDKTFHDTLPVLIREAVAASDAK